MTTASCSRIGVDTKRLGDTLRRYKPAPTTENARQLRIVGPPGMRAGELADLEADAVVQIGGNHWLRIPLGKLRNDRYVPLNPQMVTLLSEWTAANLEHVREHQRLVADRRGR